MPKEVEFKNRDRFIELGLTIAALRTIEAPNIIRPFSLEILYNIADALNIKAGDLLNYTFPSPKK